MQADSFYLPFSIISGLLISLGFLSVAIFYGVALAHSKKILIKDAVLDLPLALITGIALSLSNSIAVIEAVLGRKSTFQRTPKTGSQGRLAGDSQKTYHWRDRLILIECAMCLYFAVTLFRAATLELWSTIPFILLFFSAFSYFSVHGLKHLLSLPRRRQRLLAKQAS
jgi:hypothetical protein